MRLAGMIEAVTPFCPRGLKARQAPEQIGDVSMAITDNGYLTDNGVGRWGSLDQ